MIQPRLGHRAFLLIAAALAAPGAAWGQVALAPCERLYAESVVEGAVDYARVAAHPDRAACAQALATARPPATGQDAIAFWVDAYNLLSLLAVAEDPSRWSTRQDGREVFRDHVFVVGGERLTLDQIEHMKLPAHNRDPRVEFLLSCGARSCALLPHRLLSSGRQDERGIAAAMRDGMRRWFARPDNLRVREQDGVVEVGQLLQADWHGGDFERAGTSVAQLVAEALEARGEAAAAAALRAGKLSLVIRPYDWRVNRLRRVYVLP